jgi:hypothetical protein
MPMNPELPDVFASEMPAQLPTQLPTIVRRAEAILGKQPAGAAAPNPMGPAALPELRQRALALVSDLFATLGAGAVPGALGGALPGAGPAALPLGLPGGSLPWQVPASVAAGQKALLPLSIENAGARPLDVGFYSTDLLSDAGRSIPGHQVSFDPPRLQLRPGERGKVTARIEVPLQTAPGAYSGLLQAAGLPASKSVITIDVT